MTRVHPFLLTALICLVGTGLQAQVSPLRPGKGSVTSADHNVMAPLLDEWVRQSPVPTARNLWTPTLSGMTMTVPLTGVTDIQTLTVTLTGVTDTSSQVLPTTSVSANMLIGDVNGDKKVNNPDIGLTKGQIGMAVTNANFREDVRSPSLM